MTKLNAIFPHIRGYYRSKSIQLMIAISFTLVAVGSMVIMGVLLYVQFTGNLRQAILQENRQLVGQITMNINSYTAGMRGISNSMYYNIIKNADLAEQTLIREMSLLYEANNDSLVSIACYTEDGKLVAAAPNATAKLSVDAAEQEWFVRAISVIENTHFSTPHVQNLFEDSSQHHRWVVSLSRMVELTTGRSTGRGVLLVDMNYNGLEMIFRRMGGTSVGYAYLTDKSGNIIYHPKQQLISSGLFSENNIVAAGYSDGLHEERFAGAERQVIVKTASYTGWKVISVVPNSEFAIGFSQMRILMIAIIGFAIITITAVNALVSSMVAQPIKKLDKSVQDLEKGNLDLDIYVGGPFEIEHLGKTIRSTVGQLRRLMDDIVIEQENKRKSEFDVLQAQINPHFLYNTLDSIVWMIESERYREAISMVTALASLFRISLSKGKTVIPVRTELQHAEYYLRIQNFRYKNKFTVLTNVDPEIEDYSIIKLVLQPIVENAIYHAMKMMDGDGVIRISGRRDMSDIILEVSDNGLGMTRTKVDSLLSDSSTRDEGGSGIGLRNVHNRIRLYYGANYGLEIDSELDVGTTVRIRLPAIRESGESDASGGIQRENI